MTMNSPENAAVWFEIPVRDLDAATTFYGNILKSEMTRQTMGNDDIAMFATQNGGVGGHLFEDAAAPAGSASLVHLASPSPLETTLDRVSGAGGSVVSDIISLPDGGGRFAYCTDPDGNRFGLYTSD